jgi:alpha-glucosidase
MLGLPGQVFLYQGEELGLEEVTLPDDQRQDPVFLHTQGRQVGRDGCRIPLPWQRGRPNAGFSTASPWLPMPEGWDRYAVDVQLSSGTSMLGFYQRALELRRRLAGRLPDRIEWCTAPEGVLLYQRGPLAVACNFRSRPVRLEVGGRLLAASNRLARHRRRRLTLPPNSAAWLGVSPRSLPFALR